MGHGITMKQMQRARDPGIVVSADFEPSLQCLKAVKNHFVPHANFGGPLNVEGLAFFFHCSTALELLCPGIETAFGR